MSRLALVCVAILTLRNPTTAAPAYPDANAARGKEVFQQCSGCHSTESNDKKVGPSLRGLFRRSKLQDGRPATEENIRLTIQNGRDGMPSFGKTLSPRQMDQLIAYLKEL